VFTALKKLLRPQTAAEKWESDRAKMRVSGEELAELQREFPETPKEREDARMRKAATQNLATLMLGAVAAPPASTKRLASRCGRLASEGGCLEAILEGIRDAEDLPSGLFVRTDWHAVDEAVVQLKQVLEKIRVSHEVQIAVRSPELPMERMLDEVNDQLRRHALTVLEVDTGGDDLFAMVIPDAKAAAIAEAARTCQINLNIRAHAPQR
jgi:hypothetical protein